MKPSLAGPALALLLSCVPAAAQPAGNAFQNARITVADTRPTQVRADEYYTQLKVGIEDANYPEPGSQSKKFFQDVLGSLGMRSQTREISVNLRVTTGGVPLPELTLARFGYDSQAKKIQMYTTGSHHFPMHRLAAAEKIQAVLVFRDAQRTSYEIGLVGEAVAGLAPGTGLVNELSKPVFKHVADLGNKLLGRSGTFEVDRTHSEDLSPYGADKKKLVVELRNRAGQPFGTVTLALLASPTLLRTPVDVFAAGPHDLVRAPIEDLTAQAFNVGQVRRTYLSELRGLAEHTQMLKARSNEAVGSYCKAGIAQLGGVHGLTLMDRTYLVLQSLEEAGYRDRVGQTGWFHACFNAAERVSLKTSSGIDVPAETAAAPAELGEGALWAFGCWMKIATGPSCVQKAPDPQAKLESVFGDEVAFAIDSAFLDTRDWSEAAVVPKATLIAALKGTAHGFSCFRRGMLVTSTDGSRYFRLRGEVTDNKITKLIISPVSNDAASCT